MNKPLIVAAAVAGILVVGYAGAAYHKNSLVRERVDQAIAKATEKGEVAITYGDVDAPLFGNEVVVEAVKIVPSVKVASELRGKEGATIDMKRGITIERLAFDTDAHDEKTPPKHVNLDVAGIHLPLDLSKVSEADRKKAERLGFGDEFVMDMKVDSHHEPEQRTLQLSASNTMRNLFTLGFSADLGNIDVTALQHPETAQSAGLGLTVKRMEMSYDDQGMAEKALAEAAAREGITVEAVKAKWKAQVATGAAQAAAGRSPEFARAALDEIGRFIDDPDRLTIAFHPPEAVPMVAIVMGGLMDPEGTWKKLNVIVKAN